MWVPCIWTVMNIGCHTRFKACSICNRELVFLRDKNSLAPMIRYMCKVCDKADLPPSKGILD